MRDRILIGIAGLTAVGLAINAQMTGYIIAGVGFVSALGLVLFAMLDAGARSDEATERARDAGAYKDAITAAREVN